MPIFSYLRKFHALKIKAPSIVERKTNRNGRETSKTKFKLKITAKKEYDC